MSSSNRRRALGWLAAAASVLALAACAPKPPVFNNTDVTGLAYAQDFALTDHTGQPRTLASYKGKLVVVFFGYVHCPDVCPTTLAEWAGVMKALGPRAEEVQVLFVTLDPERDTQALMAQYAPAFDPRFVGLRGDLEQTAKTARDFKVFYAKVAGATETSYTLDHLSASYVFDRNGKVRLYVRHDKGTAPIVQDIKSLLN